MLLKQISSIKSVYSLNIIRVVLGWSYTEPETCEAGSCFNLDRSVLGLYNAVMAKLIR